MDTNISKLIEITRAISRGEVEGYFLREIINLIGSYIEYNFYSAYGRHGRRIPQQEVRVSSDFNIYWNKHGAVMRLDIDEAHELLKEHGSANRRGD